ncbi:MAG TPA: hypothetical protein VH373_02010 [Jatrophihabitantaceae bacterium]
MAIWSVSMTLAAGVQFPADRIILHGNAKPSSVVRRAMLMGVRCIVVDRLDEIATLASLAFGSGRQRVMLRVTPDVEAHTHRAMTTGTDDQKFGLSIRSGAAAEAVRRVLATPSLELAGVHCHIGSRVTRTAPVRADGARPIAFLAAVPDEHGLALPELNLGGGHAIAYHPGDAPLEVGDVARR